MVKEYHQRPPVFRAVQFDGSQITADQIRRLAADFGHDAFFKAADACILIGDRDLSIDPLEAYMYMYDTEWLVIDETGDYSVLSAEDFQEMYQPAYLNNEETHGPAKEE